MLGGAPEHATTNGTASDPSAPAALAAGGPRRRLLAWLRGGVLGGSGAQLGALRAAPRGAPAFGGPWAGRWVAGGAAAITLQLPAPVAADSAGAGPGGGTRRMLLQDGAGASSLLAAVTSGNAGAGAAFKSAGQHTASRPRVRLRRARRRAREAAAVPGHLSGARHGTRLYSPRWHTACLPPPPLD